MIENISNYLDYTYWRSCTVPAFAFSSQNEKCVFDQDKKLSQGQTVCPFPKMPDKIYTSIYITKKIINEKHIIDQDKNLSLFLKQKESQSEGWDEMK